MSSMPITRNALILLIVALLAIGDAEVCVPREFDYGSVCVCNSTYCDSAAVDVPAKSYYRRYESGKDGKRMSQQIGRFDDGDRDDNDVNTITLSVNPSITFQKINGFGGAFTDAAGINMKKLSSSAQDQIIETYYGVNGSRYSLGRVPAGGTDFSTRPYSYDDNEDDDALEKFELTDEDFEYKIPFMRKARETNPDLRFVSAAWSAPGWMKTNRNLSGGFGFLEPKYYQIYANYLCKFLTEYKKRGLDIWAISTGNEPTDTLVPQLIKFETMGWTPTTMANWVANNLGPTIAGSESNQTKIFILDDQRFDLPWYVQSVFNNTEAVKYIAAIAIHWYWDFGLTSGVLDATNTQYPDTPIILTEACIGSEPWDYPKVRLGDWNRGETYILDIIENLRHWVTGWMDWNLVLDKEGGPNYVKNFVDSPVIVNPETDEFFKQPTYYALAHFSKFVGPGSTRIDITTDTDVRSVAFLTPDKTEIVIVVYNRNLQPTNVTIVDPEQGNIVLNMSAQSIQTIIYKR